jgi:hypothetical protein
VTGGRGLAPARTAPKPQYNANLNTIKTICLTRTNAWRVGWAAFAKPLDGGGGSRFDPCGLHNILNYTIYNGATWQPMTGPCGTKPFATMMPHVETSFIQNLPINDCHIINFQLSVWTCHIIVRPLPRQHQCGLYSQHNFFLSV